jgi:hypothetical protein
VSHGRQVDDGAADGFFARVAVDIDLARAGLMVLDAPV